MAHNPDTRQRILEAAAELIYTRSFADVGIAAVCDQAKVSKGSFFHFFKSKRDLALAVMDRFQERISGSLIAKAFSPNLPPLERFDHFVKELYLYQKAQTKEHGHLPGCPFGNLVLEQATQDKILRQKADGCLRSLAGHFQSAISDAVRGGDFPPVDVVATADAMLSYIEGLQLVAKARNDPELIRRLGPSVKSLRVPKRV